VESHSTSGHILAIVSKEGKEGMKGGAEEKENPNSPMDPKRNLYPSKSRTDLK
jgi:hypothetical protein